MAHLPLYSKVVVVTGASGDIGSEFIHQLLFAKNPPHHLLTPHSGCIENDYTVVALCRVVVGDKWTGNIQKLVRFNQEHGTARKLIPFQVDLTNISEDGPRLLEMIRASLGGRIDLFINCASLFEPRPAVSGPEAIQSLSHFEAEGGLSGSASAMFKVNAWAPVIVINHLSPLFERARESLAEYCQEKHMKAGGSQEQMVQCSFVSDNFGNPSCTFTSFDPCFTNYGASRAALNLYVRHLSLYYKEFNFLLLNRGWVQPEVVAVLPELRSRFSVADYVQGLLTAMDKNCSDLSSGLHMIGWDGDVVPF